MQVTGPAPALTREQVQALVPVPEHSGSDVLQAHQETGGSSVIDFSDFAFRTVNNFRAHVVKTTVDGYPSIGIRILCDDEEQREEFLASISDDEEDEPIPNLDEVEE